MAAFHYPRRGWFPALVSLLWLALLTAPAANALTFARAQALVERSAPDNLARQAQLASAQEQVLPAAALPDPKLVLGIDNLPLEGPDRYRLDRDFMTMRRIGLMQEVPNADKRQARRQRAQAGVVLAEAEQRAMLLQSKQQTALSWLDAYYAERALVLFQQLEQQIELLRATTPAAIAGGGAQASALLQADQQSLALEDRRDELSRDLALARAELRRWVGPAADESISGVPPVWELSQLQQVQRLAHLPELRAADARVGAAQAALAEAVAEKRPDWGVEIAYNDRDRRFGDMLMLQFSFDLPLFVGSRQGPRIRAEQQQVVQLQAEQDALLRTQQAALQAGLAELEQLRKAISRSEERFIPLSRQRAELELAAYQAGSSSLAALIGVRSELSEAQLRLLELQRRLARLSASLHYAYVEGLQ